MAPSVRLQRKTWLFQYLFLNPSLTSKRLFGAVDHNDYYPNWLQFYFTLLKEHGFLLIWGIVQETTKGDCSHCQRPRVIPVDPDSCQSEKVWAVMNCPLLNVLSLTCECVRKVRLSILFHFFWVVYADHLLKKHCRRAGQDDQEIWNVLSAYCYDSVIF